MNIRLAEQSIRLRVSRSELDSLLTSRALTLEVALPRNHVFRINVRPAPVGTWALESDPTGIWITIPRGELETLAQSLPSRDGLEHAFEVRDSHSVTVNFEVDLKNRDP